jgi:methionyl-tRNA synthetase
MISKQERQIYISTPIFYPNAELHLGHAYTLVIADVLHCLHRLCGKKSWLSVGLDEHGQKVAKAAFAAERTPQEHVDILADKFQATCDMLDVSAQVFVRTTSPAHIRTALDVWDRLRAADTLYDGEYQGWYLPSDEAFCTEQLPGAIWNQEPCIFFKLSAFQERLLDLYTEHPELIYPESARHEIINLIRGGLEDLCITRKTPWGIPIDQQHWPTGPHTMYVWIDALTNYITASPTGAYYPYTLHIIGKDILRFHAIHWPAMLMALGYSEFPRIMAHGWLIQDGAKMSKSIGNVICPQTFVERFSTDALRYFCIRSKRLANDMELDWNVAETVCNELKAGFGNLVQRLLTLTHRNPTPIISTHCGLPQLEMLNTIPLLLNNPDAGECLWRYGTILTDAMWALNKHLSDTEPWKQSESVRTNILAESLAGLKQLVHYATPLIPRACRIWSTQIANISTVKPSGAITF